MTVYELIKQLENLHPMIEVHISSDPEGNSVRLLTAADLQINMPDTDNWYDPNWTADEACLEQEEWSALKQNVSAYKVILFP